MSEELPIQIGHVLGGKYRVDRVLGRGGMGVVLAATHVTLNQRVALKFLLPHATHVTGAVSRFLREAQAAVRIQSDFVARVLDVGTFENGAPYMVMEYLEGKDLDGIIAQRGPLPVAEAVEYVLQACVGLADAHAAGIVHRDLKPANLFCIRRSDGASLIKLLDFGISKVSTGTDDAQLTGTAAMLGTPMYMSPEQIRSTRDVDVRTDIWSLGVIIYEALTAKHPFMGDSMPGLLVAVIEAEPASLQALRPDVPAGLVAIVQRCLQKNREGRYSSVAALAAALAPFAPPHARELAGRAARVLGGTAPEPEVAAPSGPGTLVSSTGRASSSGVPATGTAWAQASQASHRSRKVATVVATIASLAMSVGGLVWLRARPTTPSADPAGTPSGAAVPSIPTLGAEPARLEPPPALPEPTATPAVPAPAASTAVTPVVPASAARPPPQPRQAVKSPPARTLATPVVVREAPPPTPLPAPAAPTRAAPPPPPPGRANPLSIELK